jgi:hypothetical protein
MKVEELAAVVEELIEVLHLQATELEEFISHVEQVTDHLREGSKISVVRSTLSGLHVRIRKLRGVDASGTPEGGDTSSSAAK